MNAPPVLNPAARRAPVFTLGSALRWRVPVDGSTTGGVFRSGMPVIAEAFGHPIEAFTMSASGPRS